MSNHNYVWHMLDGNVGIASSLYKDKVNEIVSKSITNQIVKLHKGHIYVESKVGEGSNFIIILPVDPDDI